MKQIRVLAAGLGVLAFFVGTVGCSSQSAKEIEETSWIKGPCSKSDPGITLSVDFKGSVTTHCAIDFEGNGWNLFRAAGFKVQGTDKYPTAFACKINDQPKSAKCDDSGSNSAYWGYYLSDKNSWTFATTGASDQFSKCGTWEGWVYMESESTEILLPKPKEFSCN